MSEQDSSSEVEGQWGKAGYRNVEAADNKELEPEVEGQTIRINGQTIEPEVEQAEVEGQAYKAGRNDEPAAETERTEVEGQASKFTRNDEPEAETPEVEGECFKAG